MICSDVTGNGSTTVKSAVSQGLSARAHRKWALHLKRLVRKLLMQRALPEPQFSLTAATATGEHDDAASTADATGDNATAPESAGTSADPSSPPSTPAVAVDPPVRTALPLQPGALAARVTQKDVFDVMNAIAKSEIRDPHFLDFVMSLMLHVNSSTAIHEGRKAADVHHYIDGVVDQDSTTQVAHIVALVEFFVRTQAPFFDVDSLLFSHVPSAEVLGCYRRACDDQKKAALLKAHEDADAAQADAAAAAETARDAAASAELAAQVGWLVVAIGSHARATT